MKLRWLGSIGLAAALALTACGGGEESSSSAASDEIEVVGTTDLKFNPTELTAATGATVNFQNASTPGIQHNFVVVKPGTEDAVAQEALPSGDIEADGENVLVASGLIDGGEDEEVELEDLEAGTYSYICTFPGHASVMRGTLTVQ
jgi:plastocyanin